MRVRSVVAALALVVTFARPHDARAQSTEPAAQDDMAPIEITAEPAVAPNASGVQPVVPRTAPATMSPRAMLPSRTGGDTRVMTTVRVTTDGERADIAFIPYYERVPRDEEVPYVCHTPCEVPVQAGSYHLVVRSEFGRIIRSVDVGRDEHFIVTPRASRALAYGLFIPGIATAGAGVVTLILAIELTAIYSGYSYYRPDTTGYWIAAVALSLGGIGFMVPGVYLLRTTAGSVRTSRGMPIAPNARPSISAVIAPLGEGGAIGMATVRF